MTGFVLLLVFLVGLIEKVEGFCSSAKSDGSNLCCEGKDIDCTADGYRLGSTTYGTCYCDSYCIKTDDCCIDYEQTCKTPRNCEVTDWSHWSGCNVHCGIGYAARIRYVENEAEEGGEPCPEMMEKRACLSTYCSDKPKKRKNIDVAHILPFHFRKGRENPEWNAITNLIGVDEPRYQTYCVTFTIQKVNKGCRNQVNLKWTDVITKGTELCVQCEHPAMKDNGLCRGDGVEGARTRWTAIDSPGCRGRWIRKTLEQPCTCNTGNDFIFI
ncbi:somatomedin-B and thrombospondin type-1 domain-containing protein-like [Anneissia japonica]|uniref:somatomedin-B and thrombospondin type-1 domain-containing protein-like n=1 Tax=Anneissia japonica TaxID=1529436 RepID=UPI001425539C|nr:somatomedin-B and thrombospondin type-1 domain-containing protein-like [Anneissia japonica]